METAKLRDAFNLFDRDGDGVISRSELESVLKSLGQTGTSEAEVHAALVLAAGCAARRRAPPLIVCLRAHRLL